MSYVQRFRYGNRPEPITKKIMGMGINYAASFAGVGDRAEDIFNRWYDKSYPKGPQYGEHKLTKLNGSKHRAYPHRPNKLRRWSTRRLHRKMSYRQRLFKR